MSSSILSLKTQIHECVTVHWSSLRRPSALLTSDVCCYMWNTSAQHGGGVRLSVIRIRDLKGLYGKINSDIFDQNIEVAAHNSLCSVVYLKSPHDVTVRSATRSTAKGPLLQNRNQPRVGHRASDVDSHRGGSQIMALPLSTVNNAVFKHDHNVSTSLSKYFFSCSVSVEGD